MTTPWETTAIRYSVWSPCDLHARYTKLFERLFNVKDVEQTFEQLCIIPSMTLNKRSIKIIPDLLLRTLAKHLLRIVEHNLRWRSYQKPSPCVVEYVVDNTPLKVNHTFDWSWEGSYCMAVGLRWGACVARMVCTVTARLSTAPWQATLLSPGRSPSANPDIQSTHYNQQTYTCNKPTYPTYVFYKHEFVDKISLYYLWDRILQ